MARIEWVKSRLDNWSLWKERGGGGGLGWATQSSFLREFRDDRYRESRVPVDDVDASITDAGVESLRRPEGELYETLQLYYVQGVGIPATASLMSVKPATVYARLDRADRLLAAWFSERKAKSDAARAQLQTQATTKNSFTS